MIRFCCVFIGVIARIVKTIISTDEVIHSIDIVFVVHNTLAHDKTRLYLIGGGALGCDIAHDSDTSDPRIYLVQVAS